MIHPIPLGPGAEPLAFHWSPRPVGIKDRLLLRWRRRWLRRTRGMIGPPPAADVLQRDVTLMVGIDFVEMPRHASHTTGLRLVEASAVHHAWCLRRRILRAHSCGHPGHPAAPRKMAARMAVAAVRHHPAPAGRRRQGMPEAAPPRNDWVETSRRTPKTRQKPGWMNHVRERHRHAKTGLPFVA